MKDLKLETSTRYLVHYQIPGVNRVPWFFVGTYIGDRDSQAQFDLRPKAGTTPLRYDHILRVEPVSSAIPHQPPKKAR